MALRKTLVGGQGLNKLGFLNPEELIKNSMKGELERWLSG